MLIGCSILILFELSISMFVSQLITDWLVILFYVPFSYTNLLIMFAFPSIVLCFCAMHKYGFIVLSHFAWSHCACFICITSFLHIMIKSCCCVLGDTCSYDSRATQILELGMSEFFSSVPNSHVKSRVCFRVLSWNSQRRRL